jgi:hypothetical protein
MSYSVSLSPDGKYLICRVSGEVTVEIAREFRSALLDMSHATNVKLFLTDARGAPNKSSVLDNYCYAYSDLKEIDFPRASRSAILVDPADRSHDFVETATRNAGYSVRVFQDEAAAITWLNK